MWDNAFTEPEIKSSIRGYNLKKRYHTHSMKREQDFERHTMKREQDFERNNNPGLSKMFGKLADEYEIYKANAPAPHKSFNEWLNS